MNKKLASAITAGALALSTVAVAPEASAAPTRNFTAPVARTPKPNYNDSYVISGTTTKPATNAKNDTSDFSSQAGDVIALLVIGTVLMGIYGFFTRANQEIIRANAAG